MSSSAPAPGDFAARAQPGPPVWQRYVRTPCTQAWDFDADATEALLGALEDLVGSERTTDGTVVSVLVDAGVSETSALMIAPSIRVSIRS